MTHTACINARLARGRGRWFQNDLSANGKEYIYIKTMAKNWKKQ
jgi:hypothetical protein